MTPRPIKRDDGPPSGAAVACVVLVGVLLVAVVTIASVMACVFWYVCPAG